MIKLYFNVKVHEEQVDILHLNMYKLMLSFYQHNHTSRIVSTPEDLDRNNETILPVVDTSPARTIILEL